MLRKRAVLFFALVAFQFAFGIFYDWVQFRKGSHFNPLLPSSEYRSLVVKAAGDYFPVGDIEAYHRAAHTLAESGRISLPNGQPSAWVTPGFPLALAGTFKVFGYHFFAVVLMNAIYVALAYLLLAHASGLIFGARTEMLTLVLLALNLRMSMFVGYVYTECLFVLCVSAALAFCVRLVLRAPKTRVWAALGLVCGFGTLVRPVFVGATLAFAVYLGLHVFRSRRHFRPFALFLALSLLPPSLWIYRNDAELGFPLVSTSSAQALADGNQDYYKRFRFSDTSQYSFNESLLTGVPIALQSANPELALFHDFRNRFRVWKSENTAFYYWLTAWRVKTLFSPYVADMSKLNKIISAVLWLLIFPAAILGLIQSRKNHWAWTLFAISFLFVVLPAFVIVGPSLRYQIPGQLLLSLLAARFYSSFSRDSIGNGRQGGASRFFSQPST